MKFNQEKFDAIAARVFKTSDGSDLLSMLIDVYADIPLYADKHSEMCLKEGRRDIVLMLKEKSRFYRSFYFAGGIDYEGLSSV